MTIHQLSVFVENKSGTLLQVLELLKEAHIQLIASTIPIPWNTVSTASSVPSLSGPSTC